MRLLVALVAGLTVLPVTSALADFYGLLTAARTGDIVMVQQLLDAGEDPDPPAYHSGYAPLQFAAGNGHEEMTRTLLAAGADTEYRDHNGDRALMWAALWGRTATAALLLEAGSPPDSPLDSYGITPLMRASSHGGNLETVAVLLDAGADPNRFDQSGDTALHHAARYHRADVVAALLDAGANPNVVDSILVRTPLHEAALGVEPESVRLLLEAGASTRVRNSEGETALFVAARMGRAEYIRLLLAARADPDAARHDGTTPILAAIAGRWDEHGDREAAAFLLAERTGDTDRALVAAVSAAFMPLAEKLLERGADVNAVGLGGVSALAASAALEDAVLYHWLVGEGADVGSFGAEALLAAAGAGNDVVVQALLDHGIAVDGHDPRGATPLLLAARNAHVETVTLLLAAGAAPVPLDELGQGPEDYMTIVPELYRYRIEQRQSSRAWRPTVHLERDLEAMRERHAIIRKLLAEAADQLDRGEEI